jgi:hypothetical protein
LALPEGWLPGSNLIGAHEIHQIRPRETQGWLATIAAAKRPSTITIFWNRSPNRLV